MRCDAGDIAGAATVIREVASGATTERTSLRRALGQLEAEEVLLVTRPTVWRVRRLAY